MITNKKGTSLTNLQLFLAPGKHNNFTAYATSSTNLQLFVTPEKGSYFTRYSYWDQNIKPQGKLLHSSLGISPAYISQQSEQLPEFFGLTGINSVRSGSFQVILLM